MLEYPEVSIAVAIRDHNFPDLNDFLSTELSDGGGKIATEAAAPSPFLLMGPSNAELKNSPKALSVQSIMSVSNLLNSTAFLGGEGHVDEAVLDATMHGTSPNHPTANSMDMDFFDDVLPTIDMGPVSQTSKGSATVGIGLDNGVPAHGNTSVTTPTRGSNLPKPSFFETKSWGYGAGKTMKRARAAFESEKQKARIDQKRPKTMLVKVEHREGGPIGLSKSAMAARNARAAEGRGEFKVNTAKFGNWKKKILLLDRNAEFNETQIRVVRHSVCGRSVKVKEPYDTTRFSDHIKNECANLKPKPSAGTSTLFKFGISTLKRGTNSDKISTPPAGVEHKPCSGITKANNERIPLYLGRTGALGGGGRSVTIIAMERFKKAYKLLTSRQKTEVLTVQAHEHQWHNDHENLRVFSTSCSREVKFSNLEIVTVPPCRPCSALLSNNNFKAALSVPVPLDKHYIHVNYRFCNRHLGHIYARTKGLKKLIEAEVTLLSSHTISISLNFDRTLNLPLAFVMLRKCCPESLPTTMSSRALLRLWF